MSPSTVVGALLLVLACHPLHTQALHAQVSTAQAGKGGTTFVDLHMRFLEMMIARGLNGSYSGNGTISAITNTVTVKEYQNAGCSGAVLAERTVKADGSCQSLDLMGTKIYGKVYCNATKINFK